ncbi:helix-turn-helix transcriptional regulator [Paenibacillus rhizoplanae]
MRIKDARKAAGYTQESIVHQINDTMKCTLRNYQNIEYGVVLPNVTLALLISHLFGVDPREVDEWKYSTQRADAQKWQLNCPLSYFFHGKRFIFLRKTTSEGSEPSLVVFFFFSPR